MAGLRGDLHICHLWQHQNYTIIDARVTDIDAKSHLNHSPDRVLEVQEKYKKNKYLLHCLYKQKHFTPFLVSVDGLLGHEPKIILK